MGSKQRELREEVRETISDMSDEQLRALTLPGRREYSNFARRIAKEELEKRRTVRNVVSTGQADTLKVPAVEPIPHRNECYVEVWTKRNFDGKHWLIGGPAECPRLSFDNIDVGGSISSLRVGAAAFVLTYAGEEFDGAMASFGPGEEIADLSEIAFDDKINSLKVINSLKIFDGSRQDDAAAEKPASRSAKQNAQRRKPRAHKRKRYEH